MRKGLFGIIYMSSYKIQLNIVNLKDFSVIEKLDSPSFVQADSKAQVFENDMAKICTALEGFKEKLTEYQIKNYKFYGNKQLISDSAASFIADQIKVRTGFEIEWLNSSQIVYYKVLSGIKSLQDLQETQLNQIPTYLLSLGSATINLSLFEKNRFISTWGLPLGPREIQQIGEITNETPNSPIDVMSDYLGARIDHLARQIKSNSKNAALVIQHADALNNYFLQTKDSSMRISHEDFNHFYEQTINMPQELLIQNYNLEPAVVEHTLPNLVVIKQILALLHPQKLYLTDMSVITGLLLQEKYQKHFLKDENGDDIIMTYAQNMAERYLVDLKHSATVEKYALHIFDRLRKIHQLPEKDRKLLAIAARVDDVGSFVNQVKRYEQSAEIIEGNNLIGLSDRDNELVSEICRYQSINEDASSSNIGGHHYRHLDSNIQLEVAKLSAILRLATALDASHKQKIKKIVLSLKKDNHLIIRAKTNADITLERWSFNKRARLFKDVFGIEVSLKQEGMNRR